MLHLASLPADVIKELPPITDGWLACRNDKTYRLRRENARLNRSQQLERTNVT